MSRLRNYSLKPITLSSEKSFGSRLAHFRKANGLTQTELAEKIGVSRSVIMDYEREKNHLYDDVIVRIAEVFAISADELLGISNNMLNELPASLKVVRRMKKIELLPSSKQKKVLENIDIILKGISN